MRFDLKKLGGNRGFSLVELMVVVAIIGILAALAVPRFQQFQAKARQSEAKNNLEALYTLQISYFGDNDTYADSYANAGFTVAGNSKYTYSMSAAQGAFTGYATETTANSIYPGYENGSDRWTIDNSKNLCAATDTITNHAHCL